jgi:transposase
MVTDAQVRLLRRKMEEGQKQEAAAAAAGMSERSARRWAKGPLPSQTKAPRSWRTRPDPLADVWESEVVPMLVADTERALQATTVLDELRRRCPDGYDQGVLRTLQRRMADWRATHGPDKEVYFQQEHQPGREGAFDFTDCGELGISIRGAHFAHLWFEMVLTHSGARAVSLAFSETFEALLEGLQHALFEFEGVPMQFRSDNLSAATHQLKDGGRELNRRFASVLEHYSSRLRRIEPGKSHQNGVVEKAHDVLKNAIRQALILRKSKDFDSVEDYVAFVLAIVAKLNARCAERFGADRAALRSLPARSLPNYTVYRCQVRMWSTIHFAKRTYSVPSRLINCEVEARQHADKIEVFYKGKLTAEMPRLCGGEKTYRIDYRHVIWSLVRKPGAFRNYRYREELFPALAFRRAYDALVATHGERADIEYVRILHLAASTMQSRVEQALVELLELGQRFDYVTVKSIAAPERLAVPQVRIGTPDPRAYDALLAGGAP